MKPRTTARGWARMGGVVLAVAGLALLAYVGWQYWGTTWVSHARQEQIVEQLERNWSAAPSPTSRHPRSTHPSVDAAVDEQTDVQVGGTTAGAILRIPAFGSSYAVPILEGTDPDILSLGVGHFTESADPGAVGNYALAAHRITHGEPFRDLPELVAGDQVIVDTARWRYTYVLDTDGDALEVDLHDTWVTDALPRNPDGDVQPSPTPGQRLITLTTCAELFHTDKRLVAFGHLVDRSVR